MGDFFAIDLFKKSREQYGYEKQDDCIASKSALVSVT